MSKKHKEKLRFYQLNPQLKYESIMKHNDIRLPKLVDKLNRELKREEDKKNKLKKKKVGRKQAKTKVKFKKSKQPK